MTAALSAKFLALLNSVVVGAGSGAKTDNTRSQSVNGPVAPKTVSIVRVSVVPPAKPEMIPEPWLVGSLARTRLARWPFTNVRPDCRPVRDLAPALRVTEVEQVDIRGDVPTAATAAVSAETLAASAVVAAVSAAVPLAWAAAPTAEIWVAKVGRAAIMASALGTNTAGASVRR